jgi:glycosyltransferase involved in cell wall biosynthesis
MNKLPVSIIVPAKNEAKNLADCLASVTWADEVFVVDSHSTDGTRAVAESFGAHVVQFDYDGGWPKKKNWALTNLPLRNEWVMILDADERVTPALAGEIGDAIHRPGIDGYYIRWKFMFLGRWMKHSWSHGWMLRLLRRGSGRYEDLGMRGEGGWDNEVHENIVVSGKTSRLKELLLHESNQDLAYWIRKQNEFSTWNAVRREQQLAEGVPPFAVVFSSDPLQRRKWLKAIYLRLPGKPLWMFVYLYLIKRGFLDGKAGIYFCALRAAHELNTSAKVYEAAQC